MIGLHFGGVIVVTAGSRKTRPIRGESNMKARALANMGVPKGPTVKMAVAATNRAEKAGMDKKEISRKIQALLDDPESFKNDPVFGPLASRIADVRRAREGYMERSGPAPYRSWGRGLEKDAVRQMENACRLPVSVVRRPSCRTPMSGTDCPSAACWR